MWLCPYSTIGCLILMRCNTFNPRIRFHCGNFGYRMIGLPVSLSSGLIELGTSSPRDHTSIASHADGGLKYCARGCWTSRQQQRYNPQLISQLRVKSSITFSLSEEKSFSSLFSFLPGIRRQSCLYKAVLPRMTFSLTSWLHFCL